MNDGEIIEYPGASLDQYIYKLSLAKYSGEHIIARFNGTLLDSGTIDTQDAYMTVFGTSRKTFFNKQVDLTDSRSIYIDGGTDIKTVAKELLRYKQLGKKAHCTFNHYIICSDYISSIDDVYRIVFGMSQDELDILYFKENEFHRATDYLTNTQNYISQGILREDAAEDWESYISRAQASDYGILIIDLAYSLLKQISNSQKRSISSQSIAETIFKVINSSKYNDSRRATVAALLIIRDCAPNGKEIHEAVTQLKKQQESQVEPYNN